jgi:hypothetical protein
MFFGLVVIPAFPCSFVRLLDVLICRVPSLLQRQRRGMGGEEIRTQEKKNGKMHALYQLTILADTDLPITEPGFPAYLTSAVRLSHIILLGASMLWWYFLTFCK